MIFTNNLFSQTLTIKTLENLVNQRDSSSKTFKTLEPPVGFEINTNPGLNKGYFFYTTTEKHAAEKNGKFEMIMDDKLRVITYVMLNESYFENLKAQALKLGYSLWNKTEAPSDNKTIIRMYSSNYKEKNYYARFITDLTEDITSYRIEIHSADIGF